MRPTFLPARAGLGRVDGHRVRQQRGPAVPQGRGLGEGGVGPQLPHVERGTAKGTREPPPRAVPDELRGTAHGGDRGGRQAPARGHLRPGQVQVGVVLEDPVLPHRCHGRAPLVGQDVDRETLGQRDAQVQQPVPEPRSRRRLREPAGQGGQQAGAYLGRLRGQVLDDLAPHHPQVARARVEGV